MARSSHQVHDGLTVQHHPCDKHYNKNGDNDNDEAALQALAARFANVDDIGIRNSLIVCQQPNNASSRSRRGGRRCRRQCPETQGP